MNRNKKFKNNYMNSFIILYKGGFNYLKKSDCKRKRKRKNKTNINEYRQIINIIFVLNNNNNILI
jgi:hypothetical protein